MACRLLHALATASLVLSFLPSCAREQAGGAETKDFFITPAAELILPSLPAGPLYWRVETFGSLAAARAAAGPTSLAAEAGGRAFLFTLHPADAPAPAGEVAAEIGPVPIISASSYLLRINFAGGPPGATTPVHKHPGSEAFYVLSGELTQRMADGAATLKAGESMNGREPGMAMQLASSGEEDLAQLVMFVVDAEKPFSSPASFD